MKKTPKSNTGIEELSKSQKWTTESVISQSFMHYPEKDGWRNRLIFTLYAWLENPENIMIEDFCFEYKIPRGTLYDWRAKYDDLRYALEQVKIFLGARRRKGAILGKFTYQAAYRDMHYYDPEWGSLVDDYHAKLKEKESGTSNGSNKEYIYEKIIEYRDKPDEKA